MKKISDIIIIILMLLVISVFIYRFKQNNQGSTTPPSESPVTNFEECMNAGFPVMESYPRQCSKDGDVFVEVIETTQTTQSMSEKEARFIAETTCIKGGEALETGFYNENSKTWWFDANLNATKPGCNPACVVSEETKTSEINWRCTGLLPSNDSALSDITDIFVQKYPNYAETLSVRIDEETPTHVRGGISFEEGAPGGIFLAAKIDEVWTVVFDGNGGISCSLSEYGFPKSMLSDCTNL